MLVPWSPGPLVQAAQPRLGGSDRVRPGQAGRALDQRDDAFSPRVGRGVVLVAPHRDGHDAGRGGRQVAGRLVAILLEAVDHFLRAKERSAVS